MNQQNSVALLGAGDLDELVGIHGDSMTEEEKAS
jgi:hypothetical protein